MKSFFKNFLGYLFSGFVFCLPIGIVAVIVVYVLSNFEMMGETILGFFIPSNFIYKGSGLILWLIIFLLIGTAVKKTPAGKVLFKIPILRLFFADGGESMTFERLSHLTPCLFLSSPTKIAYGWILSQEKTDFNELYNIFEPTLPTILPGRTTLVRKENIIMIGNTTQEMINLVLYSSKSPEKIAYIPWEDETEEGFLQRVRAFGSNRNTG